MQNWMQKAKYTGSYATSLVRSMSFLSENLSLAVFETLVTGHSRIKDPKFSQNLQLILKELNQLLQQDAQVFAEGGFPAQAFFEENPLQHGLSLASVFSDALKVSRRRQDQVHDELPPLSPAELALYPEYYRRNFHFQTDGYLSQHSSKIYDHQVEVLFSGAAGPMRRLMLPPVRRHITERLQMDPSGEGLHFLELGVGTGSLTRIMKLAFPKIRITAVDLSEPYLHQARKRLQGFSNLDFVRADAAQLPFKSGLFDGVYSCFLFHELPLEVRKQVFAESFRVLKPHGFMGAIDSLQAHENQILNWAIERFPADFHEPFFRNYTLHKLEDLSSAAGFSELNSGAGFLSKVVSAVR
jgi:ubiquinone/menaquinone biosynthesis C-methylase UbiE